MKREGTSCVYMSVALPLLTALALLIDAVVLYRYVDIPAIGPIPTALDLALLTFSFTRGVLQLEIS